MSLEGASKVAVGMCHSARVRDPPVAIQFLRYYNSKPCKAPKSSAKVGKQSVDYDKLIDVYYRRLDRACAILRKSAAKLSALDLGRPAKLA